MIVSAFEPAVFRRGAEAAHVDGVIPKSRFAERVLGVIEALFDRRRSPSAHR